ncbi:aromatic amino acid hydroxylase [Leadbetterella sp. DM7]|uniref:aromatic amino acid hydroxylase n=1 Tax=Leadbetterella sp. DM7 TaxID=3235085 RepID=UPI00349E890C
MNTFNNPQVERLPAYLRQYVVDQCYDRYTWTDQAVWRYVMRQNYSYLKHVAYYPYIRGLQQAGLSIECIPDLQTINDHLGKIGWGAVTVDGFIPPSAFMEYQQHKVLVIAADIRQLKHIEYTPAPDIIHESAGHAPIIVEPEYNSYLSYFGSIGTKAMFSARDFELYEAIRRLSILKETPGVAEAEILEAEEQLQFISDTMGEPSEMALLSRLHWWTVEYGLIGSPENPKIYGAGLLSSIGESSTCMNPAVPKLWYTPEAVHYPYDITRPQPQLFVTPDFRNLTDVLEQFADTMAFRTGGEAGLKKAVDCKNVSTARYSSGLEVSGVFTGYEAARGRPAFIRTTGPSALSYEGKELEGHSRSYHTHGFSSPVGLLKETRKPLEDFSPADLLSRGWERNRSCRLDFESGVSLHGVLQAALFRNGKLLLLTFTECTVQGPEGETLFLPGWGTYDMAVGEAIVSVFNGAADKSAWEETQHVSPKKTERIKYDAKTLKLHDIYSRIREIRESGEHTGQLKDLLALLKRAYPDDWLAPLEILEIASRVLPGLAEEAARYLALLKENNTEYTKLITDGLRVINSEQA